MDTTGPEGTKQQVPEHRELGEAHERSLIRRWPVVISFDFAQDESVHAIGLVGSKELSDRTAVIVAYNRCTVDVERVEHSEHHGLLRWQ